MKRWAALFAVAHFAQATGVTAPAPARFYRPGQTLQVRLPHRRLRPVWMGWADDKAFFYPSPTGAWRALMRVPLKAAPGEHRVRIHFESARTEEVVVEVGDSRFGSETIRFSPEKSALLNDPSEEEESQLIRELLKKAESERAQLWRGKFVPPIAGRVLSPYGMTRKKVGQKKPDFHRGEDLAGRKGDPVSASNDGVVLMARRLYFHGGTVLLSHGQGVGTIYIHLEEWRVKEGDPVKRSRTIGTVGSSGLATGPHLHWGLYVHGKAVDPRQWIDGGL